MSNPTYITPAQRARLEEISKLARAHWAALKKLELEAYGITQEDDHNGFTSDLFLDSNVKVADILRELNLKVQSCAYDNDGDGDCQHCHNRGGCKNMGGPYSHKSKYPPGAPEHAAAGWSPN